MVWWRRHGIPEQILTDNGKVFTGRFGPAGSSAEVLFDRICAEKRYPTPAHRATFSYQDRESGALAQDDSCRVPPRS
jgi:hypothetical protein